MRLSKHLPKTLNIRGITFKVKEVDYIDPKSVENGDPDSDVILGAYDWVHATIEVKKDLPQERKQITLLHEVLHGLTDDDIKVTDDEVELLSWRLYDFIVRNELTLGT